MKILICVTELHYRLFQSILIIYIYIYIYIYNLTRRKVKTPHMTATEQLNITKQMHIDGSSSVCSAKHKQM